MSDYIVKEVIRIGNVIVISLNESEEIMLSFENNYIVLGKQDRIALYKALAEFYSTSQAFLFTSTNAEQPILSAHSSVDDRFSCYLRLSIDVIKLHASNLLELIRILRIAV